ncbi:MAG TPA: hypothetical protein PLQ50_01005 [Candidatus Woesebacteria bacterium]|nr:hypothetical protein [Candidatus Woesebacteria bacterium]
MKKVIYSLLCAIAILLASNQTVLAESVIGTIDAPPGVANFNAQDTSGHNIGLLIFISNMLKFATVIAGIWVLFNFISAGFTYISASGNSSAYSKIGGKLLSSVAGLFLIAASYTIAAILGLIIFGDATFIINPQIPTI